MLSKKIFTIKNLIFVLVLVAAGFIVVNPNFLAIQTKNSQPQVKTTQSKKPSITPQINQQNSPLSDQTNQSQNSNQVQGVTTQQTPVKVTSPQSTSSQNSGTSQSIPPSQTNQVQTEKERVTLKINTGSNTYSYQVAWKSGMTVYDVIVTASSENNFSLKLDSTWLETYHSYFVDEIHDCVCQVYSITRGGENVKAIGVSLDKVEANDIITWKKS